MKSQTTEQFRCLFAILSPQVQTQTKMDYRQFQLDPNYPSLRFKKVHSKLPIYSARINRNHRVVGELVGDTVIWFWVGSHTDYEKLLGKI
ncbi:MAG: hypothetical protein WBB82_15235 [Limnothrix sp.]